MSAPLLEVRAVSRRFGGLTAIDAVNFTVAAGEIVGIMGANGAGKTTLFALIGGNLKPSAGEILLDGERIDGMRPDQVNRRGVARTFQIVRPFAGLTVRENVTIAAFYGAGRTRGRAEAEIWAAEILDAVGLLGQADRPAHTLTLVGRKRLEVARALATRPRLLLLDEVLAGLTGAEVSASLDLIRQVHAQYGLTILVIEHVMRALMRLSDRIVVLHHGQKITEGTPAEVAVHPDVLSAYLGTEHDAAGAA